MRAPMFWMRVKLRRLREERRRLGLCIMQNGEFAFPSVLAALDRQIEDAKGQLKEVWE